MRNVLYNWNKHSNMINKYQLIELSCSLMILNLVLEAIFPKQCASYEVRWITKMPLENTNNLLN